MPPEQRVGHRHFFRLASIVDHEIHRGRFRQVSVGFRLQKFRVFHSDAGKFADLIRFEGEFQRVVSWSDHQDSGLFPGIEHGVGHVVDFKVVLDVHDELQDTRCDGVFHAARDVKGDTRGRTGGKFDITSSVE